MMLLLSHCQELAVRLPSIWLPIKVALTWLKKEIFNSSDEGSVIGTSCKPGPRPKSSLCRLRLVELLVDIRVGDVRIIDIVRVLWVRIWAWVIEVVWVLQLYGLEYRQDSDHASYIIVHRVSIVHNQVLLNTEVNVGQTDHIAEEVLQH